MFGCGISSVPLPSFEVRPEAGSEPTLQLVLQNGVAVGLGLQPRREQRGVGRDLQATERGRGLGTEAILGGFLVQGCLASAPLRRLVPAPRGRGCHDDQDRHLDHVGQSFPPLFVPVAAVAFRQLLCDIGVERVSHGEGNYTTDAAR